MRILQSMLLMVAAYAACVLQLAIDFEPEVTRFAPNLVLLLLFGVMALRPAANPILTAAMCGLVMDSLGAGTLGLNMVSLAWVVSAFHGIVRLAEIRSPSSIGILVGVACLAFSSLSTVSHAVVHGTELSWGAMVASNRVLPAFSTGIAIGIVMALRRWIAPDESESVDRAVLRLDNDWNMLTHA